MRTLRTALALLIVLPFVFGTASEASAAWGAPRHAHRYQHSWSQHGQRRVATPGYEYQTSRAYARTTTGYTTLFSF